MNTIEISIYLMVLLCLLCNIIALKYNNNSFKKLKYNKLKLSLSSQSLDSKLIGISINVKDITTSKDFYTSVLGMSVISEEPNQVTLSYSNDVTTNSKKLQLIEKKDLTIGDAFVGIGIKSPDALVKFSLATALGANTIMPFDEYIYGACLIPDEDEKIANPISYGKLSDPDGYCIELIEGTSEDPLNKIILNVLDLNDSIKYYTDNLHMKLLRRRANINNVPKSASMCAYVGFNNEDDGYIELVYNYAIENLNIGTGFNNINIKSSKHLSDNFKDPDNYIITVY